MADIKELKKLSRDNLNEFAIANGIEDAADLTKYTEKGQLAKDLAPKVTPEQLTAFIASKKDSNQDDKADTTNQSDASESEDSDITDDVQQETDEERAEREADIADAATPKDDANDGKRVVYARLISSYTHPRGHRRAGFQFESGAALPQRLELTQEQYELLDNDPSIEFVTDKDLEKINSVAHLTPQQEGSTKELQNPENLEGEEDSGTTPQRRRRYVSDNPTHTASPEYDGKSELLQNQADRQAAERK